MRPSVSILKTEVKGVALTSEVSNTERAYSSSEIRCKLCLEQNSRSAISVLRG